MKKILSLAFVAALCLSLAACSARQAPMTGAASMAPQASSASVMDREVSGELHALARDEYTTTSGGSPYTSEDAKLIREATLSLESLDFDAATVALDALVASCGGYYGSSSFWGGSTYGGNQNRSAEFTVRIPAGRYDAFFAGVGDVAHVVRRSENSTDVGAEYYDSELRLNTAKTKHERLLALLEKADKMEDIITLETSLAQVQYEIDQLSGTLRRYDGLIDFATIHVSLDEVIRITDKPDERDTFAVRMSKAFSGGTASFGASMARFAEWAAYHFIGIVIFLAIAVVVFVLRKRVFGLKKRKGSGEGV